MNRILVCDDEKDIVNALKIYLTSEGYEVLCAYNGNEAVEILKAESIQLVLLDVMMPICDGITALSKIREFSNVPAVFLTAKGEDTDKVLGLNVGADDYITKPFNPVELLARVRSQLRRFLKLGAAENDEGILAVGTIRLDNRAKAVTVDGNEVSLTPTEFEILRLLMQSPGQVFSLSEIYENVWNEAVIGNERTVAVHIRHLREKIEFDPSAPQYLKVVWAQGYKIEKAGN
ncbi:MAG: response regulator transcription factor [Oscillospiraceae bacterium]|nr:response regulator transcription factor [Oscillospiraceae bacterium]